MKLTEMDGTPAEIAEYLRLRGSASSQSAAESLTSTAADEVIRSTGQEITGDLDPEDAAWLKHFIWSRARVPLVAQLVEDYITRLFETETIAVTSGTSERTKSGESEYLMVRDDGPQRFGAVVYVTPRGGRLNFRLLPDDVDDIKDLVSIRNINQPGHQYWINLDLTDAAQVDLALDLTRRALAKVRR